MSDWHEAERRFERSQELQEAQQWDEALSEVEAALRINPHNGGWHGSHGFILDQLDRFEEAIEAYRRALNLQPGDRDLLVPLAMDLIRVRRYAAALETLQQVIAQWPDFEPPYCYSILAYAELERFDEAEECFYLAQQLNEECPYCFCNIAWAKFRQGEYERAIYCWKRSLELKPDNPGVRRHIAESFRALGNLAEARRFFVAALREDPGDIDLLQDFGQMLIEAGEYEAAAEKIRLILELEPDHAEIRDLLGQVRTQQGRLNDAVQEFQRALEMDATLPGLHQRLGEAFLRQGNLHEAKRYLSVELERNPENASALMSMGNCLLEMGRPTAASYCFRKLLHLEPEAAGPYHNLAVCYFLNGRFEEGIELCKRALELRGDYVPAMHKLALAYLHLGRSSEARGILERAREVDPDNPGIRLLHKRLRWYRLTAWVRRATRASTRTWRRWRKRRQKN